MKVILYTLVSFFAIITTVAGDFFGTEKINSEFDNGGIELTPQLNNMLGYIISLLYFIAVAFAIYGGFTILTSGGDEERVKKGKNIIIYVVLGIIVIFLTSQFVHWIINIMNKGGAAV